MNRDPHSERDADFGDPPDGLTDDDVADYGRLWDARQQFAERVRAAFERVDALVTPTAPMVAPGFGDVGDRVSVADTLRNTAPFDNTGHPCVSVPCGRVDDRPVGLQVTTPLGTDALAARIARVFEALSRARPTPRSALDDSAGGRGTAPPRSKN